ncbi:partitioning defective 3 homolog B-like [Anguilla anguilla]|uniref:partitioning defective 3 homolog B-like n=1 Tax=Anguilla anguilla TaxID=7936 RepID=UPI0015A845CC|nr:partitioning defective 3 homolog B-like [Anguilla anguilla]
MLGSLDVLYSVLIHKLMAVYEEQEAQQRATVSPGRSSPDPCDPELSVFQPSRGGEIEVNSSALMSGTPLLVSCGSDSALSPPFDIDPPQPEHLNSRPSCTDCVKAGTPVPADKGGARDRTGSDAAPAKMSQAPLRLTHTVEISGESGPLGIHVIPYCSSLSGRSLGLHIRRVEENSRSKREGIFHEDECIVKINDTELMDKSFAQSQEVFSQAMQSPTVRLEVVPILNRDRYEKSLIGQLYTLERPEGTPLPLTTEPLSRPKEKQSGLEAPCPAPLAVPLSAPCPAPLLNSAPCPAPLSLPPPGKSHSPLLKKSPSLPLPPTGGVASKKGGRKLKVELRKGPEGLGFTVVTRDASVHGPGPILVKNILPRGAAVKDGRLKSGDRILEVNEVDFSGRTQEQLVAMLRSTKQGETVSLLVVRQEQVFLPRELKGERTGAQCSEKRREQLKFEIPLNDSGSAGLGICLKGNQSRETGADLGIFIKSVIHGGAAYKDGRLCVNDQLIAVNGESLLGKSNHVAMETLRRSMSMKGNLRGMIQLVLLRGPARPSPPPKQAGEVPLAQLRLTDTPAGPAHTAVPAFLWERPGVPFGITNGHHGNVHGPDDHEKDLSPFPPRQSGSDPLHPPLHQRAEQAQEPGCGGPPPPRQSRHPLARASGSTDPDENGMGPLEEPVKDHGKESDPVLEIQEPGSVESQQTGVSEVRKSELLFLLLPRARMARGRGCNQSFRAAVDKSYAGPLEHGDDDLSDGSSGQGSPTSATSRQVKKKTKEKKREKWKFKGLGKDEKMESTEEKDKRMRKKGFAFLRCLQLFCNHKETCGVPVLLRKESKQASPAVLLTVCDFAAADVTRHCGARHH